MGTESSWRIWDPARGGCGAEEFAALLRSRVSSEGISEPEDGSRLGGSSALLITSKNSSSSELLLLLHRERSRWPRLRLLVLPGEGGCRWRRLPSCSLGS